MPVPSPRPLPLGGVDALDHSTIRALLSEARQRTLWLIEPISERDMNRVHDTLMSPLVWDLGHIAAFEDLWLCHTAGGLDPLRPELMNVYDATETPRADRGDIPYLRLREAFEYLEAVRERTLAVLDRTDLSDAGGLLKVGPRSCGADPGPDVQRPNWKSSASRRARPRLSAALRPGRQRRSLKLTPAARPWPSPRSPGTPPAP